MVFVLVDMRKTKLRYGYKVDVKEYVTYHHMYEGNEECEMKSRFTFDLTPAVQCRLGIIYLVVAFSFTKSDTGTL